MHFTDQLNREIILTQYPQRIISLVPSQTELLFDLGLEKEVICITKFCIHPDSWFRTKERIGGTKMLDIEKIKSFKADLIIGNKEENEQEQILELMQTEKVWMSDIKNLNDAIGMIREVGLLTNKDEKADQIAAEIVSCFSSLENEIREQSPKKVAYFIWKKPWMAAGKQTFIDHMLNLCKLENVFSEADGRYPEVTMNELIEKKPDVIFLSSEPYPFAEKHLLELKAICPNAQIRLVDGELFSWYGSRMLKSPGYFSTLITSMK